MLEKSRHSETTRRISLNNSTSQHLRNYSANVIRQYHILTLGAQTYIFLVGVHKLASPKLPGRPLKNMLKRWKSTGCCFTFYIAMNKILSYFINFFFFIFHLNYASLFFIECRNYQFTQFFSFFKPRKVRFYLKQINVSREGVQGC